MIAALIVTLASLHINDSRHYNQINPGVGFEVQTGQTSHMGAGFYVNSSSRLSVYGVVGAETPTAPVGVGIEAGIVTGYSAMPVLPLVFPYVFVRLRSWTLKVSVLPTKRPIVGFQLRVSL